MKLRYILCVFVVLALFAGCAKPPQAEIDKANEAVTKAENTPGVDQYGAIPLKNAKDAQRNMKTSLDSKRFDSAKTHAEIAFSEANKAIEAGKNGLVRAKSEAENLIAGLKSTIEETERNINGARYSQLKLDYNQINRDFKDAKDTVEQAGNDQSMGKYQDAYDKGMNARATLGSINQQIAAATPRKKS